MPKKTKKTYSERNTPLLLEVMAALGKIRVSEKFIPGSVKGEIVYGQCIGTEIVEINPVPACVEVVLHECIHAVRPDWSETAVRQQTTRLFHRLTEKEMRTIYEVYKSRVS